MVPRACLSIAAVMLAWMSAHASAAADTTRHIGGMAAQPDLPIPSPARVIIAAIGTLVLALGVLALVKRFAPKYLRWSARAAGQSNATGQDIRVLARTHLSRSLSALLIEVDSSRVLIVEGRTGIELTVLPKPGEGSKAGDHEAQTRR